MGGLGILGANAQNPRGAGPMAPLAGAMPGLIGYNRLLEDAPKHRLQQLQGMLALNKAKQDMQLQEARGQMFGMPGTSPQDALGAEANAGGGAGPTNAAQSRIQPGNPMALNPAGVQRFLMAGGDPKVIESFQNLGPRGSLGKIDPKEYTPESFANYMLTNDPSRLRPRSKMEVHGPTGAAYDPYSLTPGQRLGTDPNKPFTIGANGEAMPNTPYQQYELTKAATGAPKTSVSVNTGKTFGESLAREFGSIIPQVRGEATGALKSIDAAHQILRAIDSGNVIAGPTANLRMKGAQVASMLGFTGPDAVVKTRETINGLAKLALGARQALKGQGQITEYEQKLLERAEAGNIDDLTIPEIRTIADLADRGGRISIRNYNQIGAGLSNNPDYAPLHQFFNVQEPAPYSRQQQPKTRRFNPQTGKIE
jgi:hypothetical protein